MKKQLKRMICLFAVLLIVAGLVPVHAEAASKTVNMKQKVWYTPDESDTIYKITVPASGYCRLYLNTSKASRSDLRSVRRTGIRIWDSKVKDIFYRCKDDTNYFALPKGTYVVDARENVKMKWDFQKVSGVNNYCRAKAVKKEAGKNTTELFDYGREFAKWYKIELKKTKKIAVFARERDDRAHGSPDLNVLILDSQGRLVLTTEMSNFTVRTSDPMPKGTYYIRLERMPDRIDSSALSMTGTRVISFTWNEK